jgi:hypothetical protein
VTGVKLSISLSRDLLDDVDRLLARPGEGRSALIARVLRQAVHQAEEDEIDAAYDRALRTRPLSQTQLDRTNALARAAIRSTRRSSGKRGAAI